MKKKFVWFVFAWYVVTTGGERVAGPFAEQWKCNEMAQVLAQKYYNVNSFCQSEAQGPGTFRPTPPGRPPV